MSKIYGYCRVSTHEQSLERQVKNIKEIYPDSIILKDEYTGRRTDRPEWSKLYPKLEKGQTIVFDSVSRMSRDAEEGFKLYQELFDKGVELVFLKEPYINTEAYREALKGSISVDVDSGDKATDDLIQGIMSAINKFMMAKVKSDIKKAFEQSEKEVEDLRGRVKEGIEIARLNGKQIGRREGDKLDVKKQKPIMNLIRKYSKDFDGSNTDSEVMSILKDLKVMIPDRKRSGQLAYREVSAKLSRNTYYKYKAIMRGESDVQ